MLEKGYRQGVWERWSQTIFTAVRWPKLFTLDAIGSLMPDEFATVGTGMLLSIGILEAEYKPGMTIAAGEKLVEKAIRSAISRDVMSGNGIDILTITKAGGTEKYLEIKEMGE
jgi:proteasome beta subunit